VGVARRPGAGHGAPMLFDCNGKRAGYSPRRLGPAGERRREEP